MGERLRDDDFGVIKIIVYTWGTDTRETEVRLDGWCEGGVRQQRNDGGGNALKTGKSGEPWYICN